MKVLIEVLTFHLHRIILKLICFNNRLRKIRNEICIFIENFNYIALLGQISLNGLGALMSLNQTY